MGTHNICLYKEEDRKIKVSAFLCIVIFIASLQNESGHRVAYKIIWAPSEDSDQPPFVRPSVRHAISS